MEITSSITYRKLTEADLLIFIQMRITQLREEGSKEDFDLVPAFKDYYNRHLADGTLFPGWHWTATRLSVQAECLLWKNRHILAAHLEEQAFFRVCLQILIIGAWELQKSSCTALWKKPVSTVAVLFRLLPQIWE